jgi:hypothetical protein
MRAAIAASETWLRHLITLMGCRECLPRKIFLQWELILRKWEILKVYILAPIRELRNLWLKRKQELTCDIRWEILSLHHQCHKMTFLWVVIKRVRNKKEWKVLFLHKIIPKKLLMIRSHNKKLSLLFQSLNKEKIYWKDKDLG